jgi:hypothetical protein
MPLKVCENYHAIRWPVNAFGRGADPGLTMPDPHRSRVPLARGPLDDAPAHDLVAVIPHA